jgi:hypothetical protein
VPEVVYVQHQIGVISEAVLAFTVTAVQASGSQDGGGVVVGERMETAALAVAAGTPSFSPREMSFLLRLIPELVQ